MFVGMATSRARLVGLIRQHAPGLVRQSPGRCADARRPVATCPQQLVAGVQHQEDACVLVRAVRLAGRHQRAQHRAGLRPTRQRVWQLGTPLHRARQRCLSRRLLSGLSQPQPQQQSNGSSQLTVRAGNWGMQ